MNHLRSWKNLILALKAVFHSWIPTLSLCVSLLYCTDCFWTEKRSKRQIMTFDKEHTETRNSHWPSDPKLTRCAVVTWRYWNLFFLGSNGRKRERNLDPLRSSKLFWFLQLYLSIVWSLKKSSSQGSQSATAVNNLEDSR